MPSPAPAAARAAARRALAFLSLAAALSAAGARAEEGAEYVLLGGGAGGLRPRQRSPVVLVSEDVTVAFVGPRGEAAAPDGAAVHQSVRAVYRLSNRGRPLAARFGVPIVAPTVPAVSPPDAARAQDAAEEIAASVRIAVAGAERRCVLQREPALPPGVAPADQPPLGAAVGELAVELAGYCVVDLPLPAGDVQVTVAYVTPAFGLEETPPARDGCARPGSGAAECPRAPERRGFFAYYAYGAASLWSGRADRVSVTVDLGGLSLDRAASTGVPEHAVPAGEILHWTWRTLPADARDFVVVASARGPGRAALRTRSELRSPDTSCRLEPEDFAASASSSFAPGDSMSAPADVVDGKANTAWCASPRHHGAGEWLELRFPAPSEPDRAMGLYVLPGLAGSQRLFEASGRVSRIRYGPCGPRARLVPAAIPARAEVADAMVKVPGSEQVLAAVLRAAPKGGEACLHVELAAAAPGADGPLCISELSVPLRCE